MPVLVGPRGWSYDDWTGTGYPEGPEERDRLSFVAEAFPTHAPPKDKVDLRRLRPSAFV